MEGRRRYNSGNLVTIRHVEAMELRNSFKESGYSYLEIANRMPEDDKGQKPTPSMMTQILLGKCEKTSDRVLAELKRVFRVRENESEPVIDNSEVEDRLLNAISLLSNDDKMLVMQFAERMAYG